MDTKNIKLIQSEFNDIKFSLDERRIRLWCATKAKAYNREHKRGGVSIVFHATGVSRRRIYRGLEEIESHENLDKQRVRNFGGGRKKITQHYPDILEALDQLVEPDSRGDPETALRWTAKSTYTLAKELQNQGYHVSFAHVGKLLSELGYSLQSNKKTKEGLSHPDRNEQFEYIHKKTKEFQLSNQPVISVDTKKRENIGEYQNSGKIYCPKGKPIEVKGHDFTDKNLGKVVPYGIYDIQNNKGWVSVGINHDTSKFAVHSIRTWYEQVGKQLFPEINSLFITPDCGGSNGYRVRLWKLELQKLANELGISIHVSHYPPGTSKWNKIEHRMFSFISRNWRGKPLIDRATVINLISNTKTKKGLEIKAVLDENEYSTGIKVSDEEMEQINIQKDTFHGEWNYIIHPQ